MNRRVGFTLLELMIALLLTSIIVVSISTALYNILRSQKISEREVKHFKMLELTVNSLSDNLLHAIDYPNSAERLPAFSGTNQKMTFIIAGDQQPAIVTYEFKNNAFHKLITPYVNAKQVSRDDRIILSDISEINEVPFIRYLGDDKLFYDTWPPPATLFHSSLPRAVQLAFSVKDRGVFTQLFILPSAMGVTSDAN